MKYVEHVHSTYRASISLAVLVGMLVLSLISLRVAYEPASLGVSATQRDGLVQVVWVLPASWGWEAGIRAGDVVQDVVDAASVSRARTLTTRDSAGFVHTAPLPQAALPVNLAQQIAFVLIALLTAAVGAVAFVLADRTLIWRAAMLLALCGCIGVVLVGAVAELSGAVWALVIVFGAAVALGGLALAVALTFPAQRLHGVVGRVATGVLVLSHAAVLLAYTWAVVFDSSAYAVVRPIHLTLLGLDLLAAIVLLLGSAVGWRPDPPSTRAAARLVALGMAGAFAPFAFLSLAPYVLGIWVWLPPEWAILSIVLLPLSIGAALVRRQLFGITRLVRRGLIALVVWVGLIGAAIVMFQLARAAAHMVGLELGADMTPHGEVALAVAVLVFTQRPLRRTLEARLFHDVYDYAEALQQLSSSITRLHDLELIAAQVLEGLCRTLDLAWATISLEGGRGEWSRGERPTAGTAAFSVPLIAEGERLGHLQVGPKRHDIELLTEDHALLATFAPLAASTLRSALLLRELQQQVQLLAERERDLQRLSARLIHVQEEERQRVSLDLHDDPLQRCILLARQLAESAAPEAPRWRRETDEVITSLRAISHDLRPPVLDDLGLLDALERLANDVRARTDLGVTIVVGTDDRRPFGRLPGPVEVVLYRVAQEALNNCAKHAIGASRAVLTLTREDAHVTLRVEDDGPGWSSNGASTSRAGSGLLGIRERLRPWDGQIAVGDAAGGGALVSVRLPVGE